MKLNNTAAVQQNACVVFKRVVADDLARQTPDSSRLEIDRGSSSTYRCAIYHRLEPNLAQFIVDNLHGFVPFTPRG